MHTHTNFGPESVVQKLRVAVLAEGMDRNCKYQTKGVCACVCVWTEAILENKGVAGEKMQERRETH